MLQNWLSVNTILITIFDYPLSFVEFFGTIFYAWSVYLAVKNKALTWPTSIIGVILFGILFYQIQLYSDVIEQIYYLITAIYGWYVWLNPKNQKQTDKNSELKISVNNTRQNFLTLTSVVIGTLVFGIFVSNIHILLPNLFPVAASFPYLDAFTTVMSFVATILLAQKKIENWYLWILVDIIGIGLYFTKGVVFLAVLYAVFLVMATSGYFGWRKIYNEYEK